MVVHVPAINEATLGGTFGRLFAFCESYPPVMGSCVLLSKFKGRAQMFGALAAAAARLWFKQFSRGQGDEFRATGLSAKIIRLPIALGVDCGCRIHGHATDRVFGGGCGGLHNILLSQGLFTDNRRWRSLALLEPQLKTCQPLPSLQNASVVANGPATCGHRKVTNRDCRTRY